MCDNLWAIRGNYDQPFTCIISHQLIIEGWMDGWMDKWVGVWVNGIAVCLYTRFPCFVSLKIRSDLGDGRFSCTSFSSHLFLRHMLLNTLRCPLHLTYIMQLHFKALPIQTLDPPTIQPEIDCSASGSPITKRSLRIIFLLLYCAKTMRFGIKWVHEMPESLISSD